MGGNGCKASFKICVSLAKSSVRGDTLSAICRCRRSGIWWSWRKIAAACSPAWYCEEPRGRRAPPYLPPDSTTASTYKKRLYSQIAGADKGAVDEEIRVSCAAHIEEAKPIGATVTVVSVTEAELPVTAAVTLVEGYSTEDVTDQLTTVISDLLAQQVFGQAVTIPYSRFLACLLQCPGVADYSTFTVNGGTTAVSVAAEAVPVMSSG